METTLIADAEIEVRSSGDTHTIRLRAVPYGRVTTRADNPGRRPERFAAGAFAGLTTSPARIRLVDENHAKNRRPVGIATAWADRADALYGDFRFYDTPEGRAAFENAREGTYEGVSVGFVATDEADVDGVREIRAARLHHVSLVDDPAYDDARILELRGRGVDEYAFLRNRPTLILPAGLSDTPYLVRARSVLAKSRR